MNSSNIEEWKRRGVEIKASFLLIVKDLEDKDYFPVYFNSVSECEEYENNIVSETKLKIIEIINLNLEKIQNDKSTSL